MTLARAAEHVHKKARTVSRGPVNKPAGTSKQAATSTSSKRVTRRPTHFVAEAAVPWMRVPDDMYGPTFDRADALSWESTGRRKMLSSHAADGAPLPKLGCSLCELEPGNTMWPFHYHLGSHEAIYVLSGNGMMRWGYPVSKVAHPALSCPILILPPPTFTLCLTGLPPTPSPGGRSRADGACGRG